MARRVALSLGLAQGPADGNLIEVYTIMRSIERVSSQNLCPPSTNVKYCTTGNSFKVKGQSLKEMCSASFCDTKGGCLEHVARGDGGGRYECDFWMGT